MHDDLAGLKHVAAVGDLEGHAGVLLDEEDRRALPVHLLDDREHLLDEDRGQTHRGLVHQQHLRVRHQGAAHGEHLLLTTGHAAGLLPEALLEPGE